MGGGNLIQSANKLVNIGLDSKLTELNFKCKQVNLKKISRNTWQCQKALLHEGLGENKNQMNKC